MRNSFFPVVLFLFIIMGFSSACHKQSDTTASGNLYIVSPEKLMDMAGKDWDALKPSLQDKKGYWYTEFPQDQNPAVKAAVSLPAIEEIDHSVSYFILMNVDRQTNKVIVPGMNTDTTNHLSFTAAANLMLEYYNRALPLTGDAAFTYGQYTTLDGAADGTGLTPTTAADVVAKLNAGVVEYQYTLIINGTNKGFNVTITKDATGDTYGFDFEGRAF